MQQRLSASRRRRAAAVKQALLARYKIDGIRLRTNGYGASRPKDVNDTLEGRRMNRRVDIELVLKKDVYAQLPTPVHAPKVPDSLPLIQASALR